MCWSIYNLTLGLKTQIRIPKKFKCKDPLTGLLLRPTDNSAVDENEKEEEEEAEKKGGQKKSRGFLAK